MAFLGGLWAWLAIAAASCSSKPEPDVCGVEQHGGDPGFAVPPAALANAPAGDGTSFVYAVDRLFLGDSDWNGQRSPDAWQGYGFNIDGKASTPDSPDHCQPYHGASPRLKQDACGGLDNSFGKNWVPIVLALMSTPAFSDGANDLIAHGGFTLLVGIDQLGPGPNQSALTGKYWFGAQNGSSPPSGSWADYPWKVAPDSLSDPANVADAKVKLSGGYVTGDTWVSGAPVSFDAWLPFGKTLVPLRIHHAIFTMALSADRSSGQGVIAGVIELEPALAEVRKLAALFSKDLCVGATVEAMVTQFRQLADIGADGSQNPGKICDGVSFGWGFHAKRVKLGAVGPAVPIVPNPCH